MQAPEDWSSISKLPADVAEEIRRERRIEVIAAVPTPAIYPDEGKAARVLSAMDRAKGLYPTDAMQSMLADQMAVTHALVMDSFRRANPNANNTAIANMHLNNATRLSSLFLKQVAAMEKRKGNGYQKVVVEHVHVNSGGQAVVGALNADPQ
jgi:hypothetical protein